MTTESEICPKCKSDMTEKVITGKKVVYYCNNCSYEWKEKK